MPFLAYVAIILVSLGGILFEVNWLTSPKLDTKATVQASTAAPAKLAEATPAKSDAPIAPRNVAPTVTMGPAAPTAPAAPAAAQAQASEPAPAPSTVATIAAPVSAAPPVAPAPTVTPAPLAAAPSTAGVASTDFKREFTTDVKPAAAATPALAVSTNNKCDVAHCSAAYQSFRASDCTFQPLEGPRKVCDRAPDTTQRAAAPARDARVETAARRPGRDAELRAVERTVRRITADEADMDADTGRSEVIMIDRRDW
jgi:hypothetical protein